MGLCSIAENSPRELGAHHSRPVLGECCASTRRLCPILRVHVAEHNDAEQLRGGGGPMTATRRLPRATPAAPPMTTTTDHSWAFRFTRPTILPPPLILTARAELSAIAHAPGWRMALHTSDCSPPAEQCRTCSGVQRARWDRPPVLPHREPIASACPSSHRHLQRQRPQSFQRSSLRHPFAVRCRLRLRLRPCAAAALSRYGALPASARSLVPTRRCLFTSVDRHYRLEWALTSGLLRHAITSSSGTPPATSSRTKAAVPPFIAVSASTPSAAFAVRLRRGPPPPPRR